MRGLTYVMVLGALSLGAAAAEELDYRQWPLEELAESADLRPCDGMIGNAVCFSVGHKGVVLGDLGLQAPATVSFWLKPNGAQADGRILSQLEGLTFQSGALRLSNGHLQVFNTKAWPNVVSGLSGQDIWQHVAVVYTADGTVTGYLNGKKGHTAQSAFEFAGVKAGIGAPFLGKWGTPYRGALDDFRVYKRALPQKEIAAMYPDELFHKAREQVPSPANLSQAIVNGTDWVDVEGRPIVAHEGELARFNGVFYWYGSSYANNPQGKFRMPAGPVWNGVQVYRSTDLKNWTYKGVCLPRPERGFGKLGATGRSHVIYNETTKKYVMWYRWFVAMPASFLMVATADHPEGPFTPLGPRQMGTSTGFGSDMNVFQDDDGKGYVIYCDHNKPEAGGNWRYAIRIDSLSDDYLTSNRDGVVIFDSGCEAPAMVKYKGKYIAVASGVHGWAGSNTKCAVADSPLGPYKKQADISEQRTWNSQVTDLIYLEESDTVLALCDQWWIPDRSDIEKSRFLFLPLYLDADTGTVKMEYVNEWRPLSSAK